MAEVTLNKVCKRYDDGGLAVDRFTLTIRDGEFLVLVGPSGCGKSTTLRMIAGLEEITSGTIHIGDRCVNAVPPKDRDVAMVFQNYALYPHMTVFENMAFGLRLRKFPRAEITARVQEAAGILGLDGLLRRLPKQLSGGQRQRVAVGRAIVRQPKVFLFDEPLSNLDAKMRVEMRGELRRLHRRLAATMVYVTHDQTEAMTMGDRIVVMRRGTIQQAASPMEVYRRPANRFVAGFIGTPPMNVLRGRLVRQPDDTLLFQYAPDARLPLPPVAMSSLAQAADREVLLGFRPEALGADDAAGGVSLRGTVDGVEPMGAETFVQLVAEGGTRLIARVHPDRVLTPGTVADFPLDMRHALFFDAETEHVIG
ncbi:MAG TPA: sn-glycerol-3-phosphate ABC transporter ATP-binding protein UgpC [Kiritimatiellia bacterium]|jgi:multiple sugar transport system ATP-binding protein|nr:sn-glycerol-3-phosphate ABC transporter ATP-binding protein UgpC [Kiritimatiellia bacterium]HOR97111.1 sn-glycerol-3-phosphate ABC transporter ATP-binding protein UgpC [Kiritimatiellia bacterium]HPC49889.1 sn-glycerol-3-phosphate ABC transporter ATP-binding protein UgpC [Kiritimatiellia bacterium]HPK37023.1 sn-glycerol-3-phosphate ABC transporter ATP-binding protein UgpC [Kiritimatiellia bacterium]HPW75209.1 sn-glycerol-3-phosphate ABC transporter ATP-binding protein UgpC [Kiritimatiellia ba